jgi:hypothetical protein
MINGESIAYPNTKWNTWENQECERFCFVAYNVQSVFENDLYVLDKVRYLKGWLELKLFVLT